jgi:hypothetical protein
MEENTEIVKVEADIPKDVSLTAEDWQVQNGPPFMAFLTGETTIYVPSPERRTELDCVSGYRDEYLPKLFQHMEKGKSYESFGGRLGLTPGLKKKFEAQVLEWRLAKELGLLVCREYWEDLGIQIADGTKSAGNASVYNTTMQALFREAYGKQQDVRHEHMHGGAVHFKIEAYSGAGMPPILENDQELTDYDLIPNGDK